MPRTDESRSPGAAPVQAVFRTMDTLELLADMPRGMTVIQLADALDVEKSIASRLLASLFSLGYLVRDPDSDRYELSLRLITLTTRYADRIGFPAVCQPVLEALSASTGELTQLSVVEGKELILAAHAQVQRRGLAILPGLGTNVTPHATASGRAWLASLDEHQAVEIALGHKLRALTPNTITKLDALLAELNKVREAAYAVILGEFVEDVNAVAVPLGQARFGKVVGTVAVSAPASRLSGERIDAVLETTRRAAEQLEAIWPADAARLADPVGPTAAPATLV